ncbi:MAG TPA: trehalose-6-phosphate synthase [Thermoanaerobaculia bacterium]|nr:trehalose-6-phosphate synthase [Thermoanaerobaculia bacterium]
MRRVTRFVVALVLGLGFLTWLASRVVERTAREWFDKDVDLRARLVVSGARQSLVSHWNEPRRTKLSDLLSEITRDERIMAAAACSDDLRMLTRTKDFPERFTCAAIGAHMRSSGKGSELGWRPWKTIESLPGGNVYVNAIPVADGVKPLGFVVLVHDLTFVERREAKTQRFIFVAFGFLALAASGVTLVAARLSWRGWSDELRGLLQGSGRSRRAEFRPLLGDVRDLVERIVAEKDLDREGGAWTAQRLAHTLTRYLHGEKVVILANREPYIHERLADGRIAVLHPASGLVTALEPVMRACSGTWIAHGSGSADRESADLDGRLRVPPGEESYVLRRVTLTREEEKGYYYGFSNEGLWPLCHVSDTRPTFRSEDWQQYQEVNRKFVDALCAEVDVDDPIVFVQDYHFALVPRLIRERLPRATVIMFWHIPWPNSQRFGICPWRQDLLEGMLGANILGFHTQFDCNNLLDSVDRFLEARIDREQNAVVQHGRSTLVRPYPIALEWPVRWLATAPPVEECRTSIFEELGLAPGALLGVGVDRLDYTKGVEERLLSVERLLERFPEYRGRFTFVQLAAPSRTAIERYRALNDTVEELTARINRRFGEGSYRPIVLRREHHEPPTVFRYYRAADVCYVSSLHDGMNLVAKEFVAAREDESGVLVLSQFTGAARELTEALIVNPYDIDEASSALRAALQMSPEEKRDRMRAMRSFISEFNVYRWAGRMLVDASRLRSRDRLTGRLTDHLAEAVESA